MHLIFNALFLAAGIKWGDWKKWRYYYPTVLFFIIGDLMHDFLFYDYPLWIYQETILFEAILRNHTFISLMIMFITYPVTLMIYLGRFPQNRWKQVCWIVFWVTLYSFIEYINFRYLNLITYHNNWNISWSIIFNLVMFPLLRVHFRNPLLAWCLSFIWIIVLINLFHLLIGKME